MKAKVICIKDFFDSETKTLYRRDPKIQEVELRPEIEKFFKILKKEKEVTESGR